MTHERLHWGQRNKLGEAHLFLPKVPKHVTDTGMYLSFCALKGTWEKSSLPLLAYRTKACAPGKTVAANPGRNTPSHTLVQHFAPFPPSSTLWELHGSTSSSCCSLPNIHHRSMRWVELQRTIFTILVHAIPLHSAVVNVFPLLLH